jgi:hypothetical protein
MQIRQEHDALIVESERFTARLDGAALTSFVERSTGTEFCRRETKPFPLELYYVHGEALGADKLQQVAVSVLSPTAARVVITGSESERELFIRLDAQTGDLCVKPAGLSARRGLASVRWNVAFAAEAALILPCVNGILVRKDNAFPTDDRFAWPWRWNAQLAIAQGPGCTMMVHSEDTACKFKALNLSRQNGLTTLGFESEQVGPLWENRNAGGVEWRLNVYEGDWHKPATRYRDWLRDTYALEAKRAPRPAWVEDISFSVGWAGAEPAVLDALARLYPPQKTLIHLSHWRTSRYDVDYPNYVPTPKALAYLNKANEMGFKVMPHFNYFGCYMDHPLFKELRHWQIRDPYRNHPQGWYYPFDTHEYTKMAYIHPGLARWRRILIDALLKACAELSAPAAFIDQTLCTWNTDNGLVENMTTIEGMRELQEELAAVRPDLVLAGEGLTEISFQRECFGQGHIHDGWGDLAPHHIEAAHPICSYLWGGHTRLVGYYHLRPASKDVDTGIEVYRRMGAIPTLICDDPALISMDQPAVKKLTELAESYSSSRT